MTNDEWLINIKQDYALAPKKTMFEILADTTILLSAILDEHKPDKIRPIIETSFERNQSFLQWVIEYEEWKV